MITTVLISRNASKQLLKVPFHINAKLRSWIEAVQESGIEEIRKISGYHDEPLKGKRKGQRSIRLNISYRAIYIVNEDSTIEVEIIEVNNHEY